MDFKETVARLSSLGMIIDSVTNVSFDMLIRSVVELRSVISPPSIRKIYLEKYGLEIKRGNLQPIENATIEIKRHYWDLAGEFSDDRETRADIARIVYLIEWMCQQAIDSGAADGGGAQDPTPARMYGMAAKQPPRTRP